MNWPKPLFSPDAGAAGGAGAAPGGAAASSPSAAGAGASGAPGASGASGFGAGSEPGSAAAANAWKAPDFLPEHLRDADVSKTFDKLAADWKTQRDRIAALPAAPKSVDEYKFDPSDKVKPYVGDLARDPAFALMRDAALKAGIPASQFSAVVGGFYEGLVDKGLAPPPYNADAERVALLGSQAQAMTEAQRVEATGKLLGPLVEQIEGLERTNAFDADPKANKAAAAAVAKLLDTADGVRALKALLKGAAAAPGGLNPGGGQASGAISDADLRKRMADPKMEPGGFAYDKGFRDETMALYRQRYG